MKAITSTFFDFCLCTVGSTGLIAVGGILLNAAKTGVSPDPAWAAALGFLHLIAGCLLGMTWVTYRLEQSK